MRVAHYVNQFFGGLGGEEAVDTPVTVREGVVGPAIGLRQALGERAQVVATIVAGDTYVAEHGTEAAQAIVDALRSCKADVLVAGPAFNAGRYGLACALACETAQRELRLPTVTAMHPDNPAIEAHRRTLYILPTGSSAADMRRALGELAAFALKLGDKQPIGSAAREGYLPRGFRRNEHVERTAAERLLSLLHAKLAGRPYASEIPNQAFETVPPAPPLMDPSRTLLAIVSEAGVVPRGNPDRIRFTSATNWATYDLDVVQPGAVEVVHGGYDASFANVDPNRVLPVDALRDLVKAGEVGGLLDRYYVTVGNGTPVETCAAFGAAIAAELQQAGVGGVVLPST
jgi:glycine reductase complex component B subunit gamma